eukprot:CAMPEP_0185042106 /NCGR_PEP_ID=MMETSP1103-20130426/42153_1 /TAXON_ID=36769 /ORGANISM="Paraphysomonas bandaiensis, Strain Caron Lab Isolate" /LENGTH=691 /DNA_ID=CAMNT_0027582111 /DNA_START=1156 /DNA_END=3231 /DNA_ORIENTATION=-
MQIGNGGNQAQKSYGLSHFKDFLQTRTPPLNYETLKAEDITVELFQFFGGYLINEAQNKRGRNRGEFLSLGSAKQYFSDAYTVLQKRFSNHRVLHVLDQKWMTDIRDALVKLITRRCQEAGVPVAEKVSGIGREVVMGVIEQLYRSGQPKDILTSAYIALTYAAQGRASEACFSSFRYYEWNFEEGCLRSLWSEFKTSLLKVMNFFVDYSDPEMCVFFTLGSYWATSLPGHFSDEETEFWIFPELALNTTSISGSFTRTMRRFVGKVPGLYADVTLKSLRVGSTNEVAKNPSAGLYPAIARGGWDFRGETAAFEYLIGVDQTIAIAGKALANYANPHHRTYPPRLVFVDDRNRSLVSTFMNNLFVLSYSEFTPTGNLYHFKLTVFAVMIMHLERFISKYTCNNIVAVAVLSEANRCGISVQQLFKWGEATREDFLARNAGPCDTATMNDIYQVTSNMRSDISWIKNESVVIKGAITQLLAANCEMKREIELLKELGIHKSNSTEVTATTPPIMAQVPKPSASNALEQIIENSRSLQNVAFVPYTTAASLDVVSLFTTYFVYDFSRQFNLVHDRKGSPVPKLAASQATNKKMIRVLREAFSCLSKDEEAFLNERRPPINHDSYDTWKIKLMDIGRAVQKRLRQRLYSDEEWTSFKAKTKKEKVCVNPLNDRLTSKSPTNVCKKRKLVLPPIT